MNRRPGAGLPGRLFQKAALGAVLCALGAGMGAWADFQGHAPWKSRALSPVVWEPVEAPEFLWLKDGKPACDIVVPESGENRVYYREVAERLKHFLDAATGESFAIVTNATRPSIFIGPSEHPFVSKLYAECAKRPMESLTVASFDSGIVLAGHDAPSTVKDIGPIRIHSNSHSKGTFYAVCDFLERMLGFRFYFPGELGLEIPDYRGQTLRLPAVRYTDQPVFTLRTSSYPWYDTMDTGLLGVDTRQRLFWSLMLRSADLFFERSNHTEEKWHETYATSHPEFFALREDGSRQIGDRGVHSAQRCYASEAGFQEHLRLIERSLAGEDVTTLFGAAVTTPNNRYIYWWPNDGYKGCACTECEKRTDRTVPAYAIYSRIIWDYALRLSAAIAERWPEKILKVPIYPYYGSIPEGVEVPSNVALNVVKFGVGRFPAAYFKEPDYWKDALDEVHEINRRSSQKIWIWVHYP
ncbi:MAG: DUF4838 domain-containing protein, partial [Kiritimatiellia bacterium]|nr:DUF4838 domain-containing protein [Kiritimatiellia bacterium]